MSAMGRSMLGMILALGCAARADAADQQGAVAACRDIADATARLACFDRATTPPPASPAASPAPAPTPALTPALTPRAAAPAVSAMPAPAATPAPAAAAPVLVAPAAAAPAPLDPEQRFGLPEHKVVQQEVAAGARDKDASKIQAQLVQLKPAPDQRMVFTLDNAQVWRELTPEGDLLAKPGDTITISRGLFGSYWLQAPSGRGSKVSRLR